MISNATPVIVNTGEVVSGINFNLQSGYKLTGRLVDGASQPVLGASGHLEDPVQKIEYSCALGGGSSNTDGTFEFNVPAGLYDLGFCKSSQCHTVFKGKIIRATTSLSDVLFSEASQPARVFNPQAVRPGYNIETVVEGGPNCASDVTVLNGKIYLAAVRSRYIYEVSSGGIVTEVTPLMVYSLQAGPDGYLYGYFPPSLPEGKIYKIKPSDGSWSIVGTVPQTSCESTLAVSPTPDPDLWIGFNGCGGTSMTDHYLYRVTGGDTYTMTEVSDNIDALDFDSSGNLYMTASGKLYQVNTSSGAQTLLVNIQAPTSHHGLVADQGGNKYITSSYNDGKHPDRVYKVTSSGAVSVLAEMPAGILQGLAPMPNGDLIGTMRGTGALYRIHLNGIWEIVLPGNGMSTPDVIAFNLAGELMVNNDESAVIVKIKNGRGEFFALVNSFLPPRAAMAFLPSGDFYFSEAAPGFQPRLILISPSGNITPVTTALDFPAGLAFDPSGQLYVVENMAGEISKVSSAGVVTPYVSGLTRPQPLAADSSGNLYVGDYSGTLQDPSDPAENPPIDRIWKVDTSGVMTPYLNHEIGMIAISPTDQLFISGRVGDYYYGVLRVNADKSLTPIAVGFLDPVGLAFDVAGDLYVADNMNNSIVRITGFSYGQLAGHITNSQNGAQIPQAVVTLITGYPLIKEAHVNADTNGYFNIQGEPRQYTLTVSAIGFCPKIQTITVSAGATKTVDLSLQPCPANFLPVVMKP
jgi:sugar lactone lactonase YvrE